MKLKFQGELLESKVLKLEEGKEYNLILKSEFKAQRGVGEIYSGYSTVLKLEFLGGVGGM